MKLTAMSLCCIFIIHNKSFLASFWSQVYLIPVNLRPKKNNGFTCQSRLHTGSLYFCTPFLSKLNNNCSYKWTFLLFSHSEVEQLCLLLVGPSLGQTWLVQVAVRHAGLDWFGGWAVGKALGDVIVIQHRRVLQGGQSRTPGLLYLNEEELT